MEVSMLFQESFQGDSNEFQKCFKKEYFKKVSKMFQGRLKAVSRLFERSSKGILDKFERSFKKVSRLFQGRLNIFLPPIVYQPTISAGRKD